MLHGVVGALPSQVTCEMNDVTATTHVTSPYDGSHEGYTTTPAATMVGGLAQQQQNVQAQQPQKAHKQVRRRGVAIFLCFGLRVWVCLERSMGTMR